MRSATWDVPVTVTKEVTDDVVDYYRKITLGGAGMIITGDFPVTPDGGLGTDTSFGDVAVSGLERIAEVVHRTDDRCMVIAQLNTGYVGKAPSQRQSPFSKKPTPALSDKEIKVIIECFAQGVIKAKSLGYDGVQFHAAHGTLLCDFLSPYANKREDDYGGTVRKRVNIIREIVDLARQDAGDFPIFIKANCTDYIKGGIDADSFPGLASEIENAGIDAIEVSGGRYDCLVRTEEELGFRPVPGAESHTRINSADKQSYFYPYTENLHLSIPVILVGGNKDVEHLEKLFKNGRVDFMAMCRPLICEPDLPNRWLSGKGKSVAQCISCNSCIYDMIMNFINKHAKITRCLYKEDKGEYKKAQKWLSSWVADHKV
ncbi:MAG: NADH:flavin oxidoreductase [candidate division WOR-3 bacterium]|nr:MAG: NADH:flavin oxidoreductase [candidate division WOR-3 bacterium]